MKVLPLNINLLEKHLNEIIDIDQYYIEQLGEEYTTFKWDETNFKLEKPGKWKLSQLALIGNQVVGFWIASRFQSVCHTHRVAVHPKKQHQGISTDLWKHVHESAKKLDIHEFTVVANINNKRALNFYKKLGFSKVKEKQTQEYLKQHNRKAEIIDNYIQENNGSKYYILKLSE